MKDRASAHLRIVMLVATAARQYGASFVLDATADAFAMVSGEMSDVEVANKRVDAAEGVQGLCHVLCPPESWPMGGKTS